MNRGQMDRSNVQGFKSVLGSSEFENAKSIYMVNHHPVHNRSIGNDSIHRIFAIRENLMF